MRARRHTCTRSRIRTYIHTYNGILGVGGSASARLKIAGCTILSNDTIEFENKFSSVLDIQVCAENGKGNRTIRCHALPKPPGSSLPSRPRPLSCLQVHLHVHPRAYAQMHAHVHPNPHRYRNMHHHVHAHSRAHPHMYVYLMMMTVYIAKTLRMGDSPTHDTTSCLGAPIIHVCVMTHPHATIDSQCDMSLPYV